MFDRHSVVTKLHDILKPFLLRRLKVDVEPNLPPKKEYLLYAPLTQQQSDIYKAIVSHNIRDYLIDLKSGVAPDDVEEELGRNGSLGDEDGEDSNGRSSRRLAKRPRLNYHIDENDDKFARDLEAGRPVKTQFERTEVISVEDQGKKWAVKQASELFSAQVFSSDSL